MKSLWNAVSFLAVVHLLALLAFGGWLWQSGRVNAERIDAIRTMLAPTVEEVLAAAEEEKKRQAMEQSALEAEARMTSAPVPAGDQVALISKARELTAQSGQTLAQERAMFAKQLEDMAAELAQREAALEARQQEWEKGIEAERARRSDVQFAKSVTLLEQMGAKPAKDAIVQLMREGSVEQAVAYMNAMSERTAARILVEMKDPSEAGMATILLERLRRFGLEAEPDEVASHVDASANAP